jgi:hypothetical protein
MDGVPGLHACGMAARHGCYPLSAQHAIAFKVLRNLNCAVVSRLFQGRFALVLWPGLL